MKFPMFDRHPDPPPAPPDETEAQRREAARKLHDLQERVRFIESHSDVLKRKRSPR